MNGKEKARLERWNCRPIRRFVVLELEIAQDLPTAIVTADGRQLFKSQIIVSKKAAVDGKRRVAVLEELAVQEFGVDLSDPALERVID